MEFKVSLRFYFYFEDELVTDIFSISFAVATYAPFSIEFYKSFIPTSDILVISIIRTNRKGASTNCYML